MTFPTLFAIAMDYIPIQASSVPCERAFSSSAETDTKKHNCMGPILMECLQMIKFAIKKECLDLTSGLLTAKFDMLDKENPGDMHYWLVCSVATEKMSWTRSLKLHADSTTLFSDLGLRLTRTFGLYFVPPCTIVPLTFTFMFFVT
jgi:hAT family C-terminal dimerisation region